MSFLRVWEYQVRPACTREFEEVFGPGGPWVALFGESEGHVSTDLLRDAERPERYLVLDRWRSAAAHRAFREARAADYEALDRRTRALCETEARVGAFGPAKS